MKRLLLFTLLMLAAACSKKGDGDGIDWNDGKIRDGDGNVYTEITVGDQIWLREDLRTTKLNDRKTVLKKSSGAVAEVAYNIIYNDDRGYEYSLDAALLPNICPEGYRVPTWEDFDILIDNKGTLKVFGDGDWWSTTIKYNGDERGAYYRNISHSTGSKLWHNDTYKHPIRCIKKTES